MQLVRIAWAGAEGQAEMVSMVGEKVVPAMEAADTLMVGGTQSDVIARYRELVAGNTLPPDGLSRLRAGQAEDYPRPTWRAYPP